MFFFVLSATMSTIPLPEIPKISGEQIREATFTLCRQQLNSTESKFLKEGFWKRSDGSVECYSCGIKIWPIFGEY